MPIKIKFLLWLGNFVRDIQYKRSKKRLERGILVLYKVDHFFHTAGISRQERRQFWREFGSNEANREEILRKLCQRLGLKEFDKICSIQKEGD